MALLLKASKVIAGNPEELVLESGQLIIGRLPSNHLVIPGANVEPIHAMVEVDPETQVASLVDMASEAGILLNGKLVEVVEPIKAGDRIQIGDVRIDVLDAEKVAVDVSSSDPKPPPGKGPRKEDKGGGSEKEEARAFARTEKSPTRKNEANNYNYEGNVKRVPRVQNYGVLFQPGKERPGGSTLEVVAFWDQSILDVRHYGGQAKKDEEPRSSTVYLGNEEDGHIIGIGPRASTRNYRFAEVGGSKSTVYLDADMRARVRRGSQFEKISGPAKFSLGSKELALVKHGPVSYFMTNVSLPNPNIRRFEDPDGRPIIFWYVGLIYALITAGLYVSLKNGIVEKPYDEEAWGQMLAIRTPTPKPKEEKPVPAPKPTVEIKKPEPVKPPKVVSTPALKPPEKPPEKPREKPVEKAKEVVKVKAPKANVSLDRPKLPPKETKNADKPGAAASETKNKDTALGPKTKAPPGNGGGPKGGTAGAFAGAREGKEKASMAGVEDGKKNVMSGINLDKLGAGLGKVSDIDGVGAVATGLKSSSGGAGGGSGSGARGSHGLGGLGNASSLSTGGPGRALSGIGGGAGGLGAGGLGGSGGAGGQSGRKLSASVVVVPEGDPAIEGSLTKEEIEAVIRANLAQIKACYERFLQGNRDLGGRVTSQFTIGTDGRVTSANISGSDLNSSGTEGCIAGAIRRWKFPIPRGGGVVQVKYPFVFSSR